MLPFWLLIFDLTQQVLVSISDLIQQIFVVFLQTVSVYCTQNSPKVKMPVHEKVEINLKKKKMGKNDPFARTVWIDGCACLLKFECCWFEFSLALEREYAWMSSRVSNCYHVKWYTCMYVQTIDDWRSWLSCSVQCVSSSPGNCRDCHLSHKLWWQFSHLV